MFGMKRRHLLFALPALAAGCHDGWGYDDPPSVSVAASVTDALPGEVIRLVAAATDDDYVDEVDFFRIDPDGRRFLLGTDGREPWEWEAVMPNVARGETVWFFARAYDGWGQSSDSVRVGVVAL
jgi:hypothetical protein